MGQGVVYHRMLRNSIVIVIIFVIQVFTSPSQKSGSWDTLNRKVLEKKWAVVMIWKGRKIWHIALYQRLLGKHKYSFLLSMFTCAVWKNLRKTFFVNAEPSEYNNIVCFGEKKKGRQVSSHMRIWHFQINVLLVFFHNFLLLDF